MLTLLEAVTTYFPNEQIQNQGKAKLKDSWILKIKSLPVSWTKYWYKIPVDFIETDKKLYFDKRQSYLFNNKITVILGMSLAAVLLLIGLFLFVTYPVVSIFCFFLSAVLIFQLPLIFFINYKINQGLTNILTIKKSWVKNTNTQAHKKIVYGEVPEGQSYFFRDHLIDSKKEKLPFIFQWLIFHWLFKSNRVVSSNFKLEYTII